MNNNLTRLLGVCAAAAMAGMPAAAFNNLVVHTTDAQQRFPLASIDQLTFGEQGLNVGLAEGDQFFNFADLARLTFASNVQTGDVDGSGKVDITDVNIIINAVLDKAPKTAAMDANSDGKVDITDVNQLINIILDKNGAGQQYGAAEPGSRMLVHGTSGSLDVLAVDQVASITFSDIAQARADIALIDTDEASIRATITRTEGCERYQVACWPEATAVDDLEAYIQQNKKYDRKVNGGVEFIDLEPSTTYVIGTLAYDAYGLPCEVATLTATTTERGELQPAQVGDFLYADGSWSTDLKPNKTPVAIVYSTSTSAADQAAGYTHGYAIALRDAGKAAWTTEAGENESGASISSEGDADLNDRDGLTHTATLLANAGIHPAAALARDYANAPQGTSGWFLPATGQWIDALHALGSLDDSTLERDANGIPTWSQEASAQAIAAFNTRLATAGSGNYDALNQTYYWTSSERSVASAYYLYASASYFLSLQTYYKNSQFAIRPMIAF